MKTIEYTVREDHYSFEELDRIAKNRAKEKYLERMIDIRNDVFHENIINNLSYVFPNSDLMVEYSLNYNQGDGLNIYGTVNLKDALDCQEISDKLTVEEKNSLSKIVVSLPDYELTHNSRYGYSCKFIDRYNMCYTVECWLCELNEDDSISDALTHFFCIILDYFEHLDSEYKREGYDFLYNITDEEMTEECDANEITFDKSGEVW